MLYWQCQYNDCTNPSVPDNGDCGACGKHLCKQHLTDEFHPCRSLEEEKFWEAVNATSKNELQATLEAVRKLNMIDLASQHRPGHTCIATIPNDIDDFLRGGINLHIPITFDDGVKWLARIPQQNFKAPPYHLGQMITESAIVTMDVLKGACALIPSAYVPLVLPKSPCEGKGVNEPNYHFLDYLAGSPCPCPIFDGVENQDMISNTLRDLAKFYVNLSSVSFPSFGSLIKTPTGETVAGPLISTTFCNPHREPYFPGPFRSAKARWLGCIDHVLNEIEEGKAFQMDPVRNYLAHLEIRETVMECERFGDKQEECYIKHADDKGDQILVDAEGNITGIIDWDWAYTTSKAEAFASPLALIDPDSVFTSSNDLTAYEERFMQEYINLGRPDLADCIKGGRLYLRLDFTVGKEFDEVMMEGLRDAMGRDKLGLDVEGWEQWARDRYRDHKGLRRVIRAVRNSAQN
nr:uncharacterized protein CI109_005224 [Kwoniella shandongensis]KAA5526455.1 hypothetical protein CI109_005224 [Kwoniella shandongensis]